MLGAKFIKTINILFEKQREIVNCKKCDFPNKVSQKSKISIIVKSSKHYIKQFKQLSLYSTLTFSLIEASFSTQKGFRDIEKRLNGQFLELEETSKLIKFLKVRA